MGGGSPKFVMAIRIGHDKPKPMNLPQYMKRKSRRSDLHITGGWGVGFLFREIMDAIHAGKPVIHFSPEIESGLTELLADYPEKYR
jgi:hypothetical protein